MTCPKCRKHFAWTSPKQPKPSGAESNTEQFSQPERPRDEWDRGEWLLFCLICIFVLGWTLSSDDSRDLGGVWGFIDFELRLVFALIIGFVAVAMLHLVIYKGQLWKYERARCPHGVPGGITTRKCQQCIEHQRQQEAKRRAAEALAARRAQLRKEARNLGDKEIERLADQIRRDYRKLLELSPRAFEDLVSELFRKKGYTVKQTPYTNDRGRDAIARKGGKTYLVECKRYARARIIGRRDLQIFHSAMTEEAAAGGFFVTTGKFGKTTKEFARDKKIELIDENRLIEMMRRYMPYDSREADTFRVMCEECGIIVERRLSRPQKIVRCVQGHEVSSAWTDKMCIEGYRPTDS